MYIYIQTTVYSICRHNFPTELHELLTLLLCIGSTGVAQIHY